MVCAVCSAARLSTPAPPEPLPHLYASANQLRNTVCGSVTWIALFTTLKGVPPQILAIPSQSIYNYPLVLLMLHHIRRPVYCSTYDVVMDGAQVRRDHVS